MSRDTKDNGHKAVEEARYGEELLSANWNPVIDLLRWSCARTLGDVTRRAQEKLQEEDAEAFLGRIYHAG
jgi:hypothetical protein